MKIGIISDAKNASIKNELMTYVKSIGHEPIDLNKHSGILENCDELVNAYNSHTIDRGLAIDDWGIITFMYLAKNKGIVVAEINDEHSARMTTEHNNSSILTFGSEISTINQMKRMVDKFLAAKYEGGRHKVRIDMMDTLLEKEDK